MLKNSCISLNVTIVNVFVSELIDYIYMLVVLIHYTIEFLR